MVQWLRLCVSSAEGLGSIPGRGTKIPRAVWHGQKIKKKKKSHSEDSKGIKIKPPKTKNGRGDLVEESSEASGVVIINPR